MFKRFEELEVEILKNSAASITRDKDIKEALLNKDRESLQSSIETSFFRMFGLDLIDNLIVISTKGEILYSGEHLRDTTELINQATRAIDSKNLLYGLMADSIDRVNFFYTFPIFNAQHQPLAAITLEVALPRLLKRFKQLNGSSSFQVDLRIDATGLAII